MEERALESIDSRVTRLGVVLRPNGEPAEAEGVLNPASARSRDGKLLLYPRAVSKGNVSRIGLAEAQGSPDAPEFARHGFALEPQEPYEIRNAPGGYGCEDPRVTFVPALDRYVMAYTAYGPGGPRIALALSRDGYDWQRLGLVDFSAPGLPAGDDKDAAFFPEPVLSPKGVPSFAFYHRPMLHVSALDGLAAVRFILDLAPEQRECTRIAYVPLEPALRDPHNLLVVAESAIVLPPGAWGAVKTGGGTPPVRIAEGWMSLYHGVDGRFDESGRCIGMKYSAGVVIHDAQQPHIVRYRSPAPVLAPETADEMRGIVNEVVFPTAIDVRPSAPARTYDVYYGMADARIGRVQLELGESVSAIAEESAA
jgi:predicted GH43/DUF377 family glycosyl hydrolase